MYKFITVARNIMSDIYPIPMYIYQNEENNKYYMSRMYPTKSIFQGQTISNQSNIFNFCGLFFLFVSACSEFDGKSGC